MSTSYLRAANRTIRARGLERSPQHAAIVLLLRDLARQMDAAGPEGPSGRLQERYRGALKQLGPMTKSEAARPSTDSKPNALEAFMRKWKVGPEYDK